MLLLWECASGSFTVLDFDKYFILVLWHVLSLSLLLLVVVKMVVVVEVFAEEACWIFFTVAWNTYTGKEMREIYISESSNSKQISLIFLARSLSLLYVFSYCILYCVSYCISLLLLLFKRQLVLIIFFYSTPSHDFIFPPIIHSPALLSFK